MRSAWQIFLIAITLTTFGCRSSKINEPKSSYAPTRDRFGIQTDTMYVNVTINDVPTMEALKSENRDLKRKKTLWQVLAGVFFMAATGTSLGLLSD